MADDQQLANPYLGPRPFEASEADEQRFFGRGQETAQLAARIAGHQVVLVYAQSGAGKTSLYNAGIRKELLAREYQVLPATRVVGGHLDDDNPYLANALAGLGLDGDARRPDLAAALDDLPPRHDRLGRRQKRVAVFDQFEELFADRSTTAHHLREEFFDQIDEALGRDPLLRLVFLMREDRVAELDPYAARVRHRFKVRFRLERLDVDAAREAIVEPAARLGRHFEDDAVDYLVDELRALRTDRGDVTGHGRYVEPVSLQVVCYEMWPRLDPGAEPIPRSQVEEHGDVTAHLGAYYDHAVAEVADAVEGVDEGRLRAWADTELITRDLRTRSRVARGQEETGDRVPIPNEAVDGLVDLHVVREDRWAGARWYELAHDRFVEPILERNQAWRDDRWEAAGRPYEAEARAWLRLNRDPKALLRGRRLEEAQVRIRRVPDELVLGEVREFLEVSAAFEEAEIQRQNRRRRVLLWIAAAVIAALAALLAVAVVGWLTAVHRARVAEARTLAATAQATIDAGERIDRPLLLAVAAARLQPEDEARASLLAALSAGSRLRWIQVEHGAALTALDAVPGVLAYAGERADGAFVAVVSDSVLRVPLGDTRIDDLAVDAAGTRLAFPTDATGSVAVVDFDADARFDLPAIEETDAGDPLGGHIGKVRALAFDPRDRDRLVTAGDDGQLILWDLGTRVPVAATADADLPGRALDVAFGPDGTVLATAGADGWVRLWDAATLEPVAAARAFDGLAEAVAFGPGGELAAGGRDGRVFLWPDPAAGLGGPTELRAGGWAVTGLAFHDGGLAVASGDGTVELLGVETLRGHFVDRLPPTPEAATDVQVAQAVPVTGVASPQPGALYSVSADGSLVSWEPAGPPGFGAPVAAVAGCDATQAFELAWLSGTLRGMCGGGFRVEDGSAAPITGIPSGLAAGWTPDGRSVAVATADRIQVFAADGTPGRSIELAAEPAAVAMAGGRSVAWAVSDGRLFISTDPAEPVTTGDAPLASVAITVDGGWVAAGDGAGALHLWEVGSAAVTTVPLAPAAADGGDALPSDAFTVADVAFTPDGACAVAAGPVGAVVVVPVPGFDRCVERVDLFGHRELVSAVAVTRDGDLLASGGRDGEIILWDARTLLEVTRLAGGGEAVVTLAFGERDELAAGMADGTMLVWRLGIDDLVELACDKLAGTDLTPAEWDRYGGGSQPCP